MSRPKPPAESVFAYFLVLLRLKHLFQELGRERRLCSKNERTSNCEEWPRPTTERISSYDPIRCVTAIDAQKRTQVASFQKVHRAFHAIIVNSRADSLINFQKKRFLESTVCLKKLISNTVWRFARKLTKSIRSTTDCARIRTVSIVFSDPHRSRKLSTHQERSSTWTMQPLLQRTDPRPSYAGA